VYLIYRLFLVLSLENHSSAIIPLLIAEMAFFLLMISIFMLNSDIRRILSQD
jgi:hypothetical protein